MCTGCGLRWLAHGSWAYRVEPVWVPVGLLGWCGCFVNAPVVTGC